MTKPFITIERFQGREGSIFTLVYDELKPITLTLVEVSDDSDRLGRHALEHLSRIPFTLVFRGPLEPVLPQGIYRLKHPEMGVIEQLLVPIIDLRRDGIYYQIIYN